MTKKLFKSIMSSMLAIMMLFGVIVPSVLRADDTQVQQEQGTKKVTLHKLLLTKQDLADWKSDEIEKKGYNGTQNFEQFKTLTGKTGLKEIAGVYFAWQKKDTDGSWKYIKDDGSVLGEDVNAEGVFGKKTENSGAEFDTSKLPAGTYKIVEVHEKSSYVGTDGQTLTEMKAVPVEITLPLVKEDGAIDHAHVYPKNTEEKPQIDKNFEKTNGQDDLGNGADYENYQKDKATVNRQIGSKIPYEVKTKIPKDVKYKTLRWEDTMTKGLTYNKDLKIEAKYNPTVENGSITITNTTHYTVENNGSGFVLKFTEAGLKAVEEAAKKGEIEFTLKYSATLNGDAVVDVPEENNIKFDYSNNSKTFNEPRDKSTKPKEKKITVNKTWTNGTETTAPKDVKVQYYLYEKGGSAEKDKVVGYVEKKDGDFNHTFENLDEQKEYYVKEIVSGYTAEYTSATDGTISLKNNKDNDNPSPLIPTHPKVVTYGKKFVKTDDKEPNNTLTPLSGAEFVVMNKEKKYLALKDAATVNEDKTAYTTAQKAYDDAISEYNKLTKEKQQGEQGKTAKEKIEAEKVKRDKAFLKVRTDYEWVTESTKAVKFTSNSKGQFEVIGLAAGKYHLKETKAPEGYALRSDLIEFTVDKDSYTKSGNIAYESAQTGTDAMQVKNKKITIPQTGGVGTLIFAVVGISLMGVAVYAMKRRNSEEK